MRYGFHGFAARRMLVSSLCILCIQAPAIFAAQVVLGWDHTLTRIDGTPLESPATYRIHYGTNSGQYDQLLEVGATNLAQITGLGERVTYYFAVTACDDVGLESLQSEELEWNSFIDDYPALPAWLEGFKITNRAEDVLEQDDDDDSVPIWQEYIMDTDPTDPDSHLQLMSMVPVFEPSLDGTQTVQSVVGYVMNWRCSTNRIYDVEYTLDLLGGTWAAMDGWTGVVPSSGEMIITNLIAGEAVKTLRLVVRHP